MSDNLTSLGPQTNFRRGDLVEVRRLNPYSTIPHGCVGYIVGYESNVRRCVRPGQFDEAPGFKVSIGSKVYDVRENEVIAFP